MAQWVRVLDTQPGGLDFKPSEPTFKVTLTGGGGPRITRAGWLPV